VTKTIGYLTMLSGAIALIVGLAMIVHENLFPSIVIGLGVLFGAAGWYIAKKQPQLPGVK
jgi:hypothetical protein